MNTVVEPDTRESSPVQPLERTGVDCRASGYSEEDEFEYDSSSDDDPDAYYAHLMKMLKILLYLLPPLSLLLWLVALAHLGSLGEQLGCHQGFVSCRYS